MLSLSKHGQKLLLTNDSRLSTPFTLLLHQLTRHYFTQFIYHSYKVSAALQ